MRLVPCGSAGYRRPALAVALLAAILSTPLRAQDTAARPLTRQRLLETMDLLKGEAADVLIPQIQQRGVNFQTTAADERDFRVAGASDKLLAVIRDSYRAPALAPVTGGIPLGKDELTLLLQNGVPASRLEDLVAVRGVSFAATPEVLEELRAVGAGNRLIDLVRLRGVADGAGTQFAQPQTLPVQPQPQPVQPPAQPPAQPQAQPVQPQGVQDQVNPPPESTTMGAATGTYAISFVETNRKWRLGLRSESYDKVSQNLQNLLVQAFTNRGLTQVESLDSPCCRVVIELLEVTAHPAIVKKPGMDVAATISVLDASGAQIYSKGYRGEARTVMSTWGHLINHAAEDLVANANRDEELMRALFPASGYR